MPGTPMTQFYHRARVPSGSGICFIATLAIEPRRCGVERQRNRLMAMIILLIATDGADIGRFLAQLDNRTEVLRTA